MKIERVHDCLDGAISEDRLTEQERRLLEDTRFAVEESLRALRQAPAPDVVGSVMARIAAQETAASPAGAYERKTSDSGAGEGTVTRLLKGLRVALGWIWTPRPVRLRPAWVLGGLTAVALGTGLVQAPEVRESTSTPVLYVRFDLEAANASTVAVAGSFTGWEPLYELREQAPGQWTALVPLHPGVHDYGFVVDGEHWVADPDAIPVEDGFGGVNSRIAVLGPDPADGATGSPPTGTSS